jgi:hypothetical protein
MLTTVVVSHHVEDYKKLFTALDFSKIGITFVGAVTKKPLITD